MLRWLLLLWLLLHLLCTCLLLWRGLGLLQVPCGLLMSSGHPASQEMAQLGMGLFPARVAKASGVTRKGRSTQTRGICARNAHALFFSPIERLGAGNAGDTFRTGFKCVHHSRQEKVGLGFFCPVPPPKPSPPPPEPSPESNSKIQLALGISVGLALGLPFSWPLVYSGSPECEWGVTP